MRADPAALVDAPPLGGWLHPTALLTIPGSAKPPAARPPAASGPKGGQGAETQRTGYDLESEPARWEASLWTSTSAPQDRLQLPAALAHPART